MFRNMKVFNLLTIFTVLLALSVSCEDADDLFGNEQIAELEGEWSVDENSEIFDKSTMSTYTVSISADPDNTNGIIIDNFYNVGISVRANVSGNSLTIPNQNAEDGYSVHGSGTISLNRSQISLDYIVNDGSSQDDHCTAIYTKR